MIDLLTVSQGRVEGSGVEDWRCNWRYLANHLYLGQKTIAIVPVTKIVSVCFDDFS